MDVSQKGRDPCLVAVSILIWASMTFPTLDPEQAAPLETQIAALQEKVDALPEGDEARTPLEEELPPYRRPSLKNPCSTPGPDVSAWPLSP